MYDTISHIWLFLAASLFAEGLAIYALRFPTISGARQYAIHKGAIALLLLSLIMATVSSELATKIFWIKLYHTGTYVGMLAWLVLSLQMTGHGHWWKRRPIAVMLIVFAMAITILFTNAYGLYWREIWEIDNNVQVIDGLLHPVILFLGYLILLFSTVLFIYRFTKVKGILRAQAGIIICSTAITMVGHFCWRFAPTPVLRQDLLAAAFIMSGLMDAFALFRLRMFDVISLAQAEVTQTMGDGLVVIDNQDIIVGLNPAAERMIAKPSNEVSGSLATKIFEPWPELIDRIQAEETSEIMMERQYYNVLIVPLTGPDRRQLGKALVLHDITAERAAQELLIEQQRAVAILKERERLSRELHDGHGQLLGYFNMQLEAACSHMAQGQSDQAELLLKQLVDFTQGLHVDIRESITGLKFSADEDFLHTMDEYLRWFERNYNIKTNLEVHPGFTGDMLSPTTEVQLQRIIQEALTNARKHADARQVWVTINLKDDKVEIIVEDDGVGFDFDKALLKEGNFGLRIMQERAVEIGADFDCDSKPKAGTRMKLSVPFKA